MFDIPKIIAVSLHSKSWLFSFEVVVALQKGKIMKNKKFCDWPNIYGSNWTFQSNTYVKEHESKKMPTARTSNSHRNPFLCFSSLFFFPESPSLPGDSTICSSCCSQIKLESSLFVTLKTCWQPSTCTIQTTQGSSLLLRLSSCSVWHSLYHKQL